MKTFENVWRLVFCVFIFFVIRDRLDKMLATPPLEPKVDWSKLSNFKGLEDRQIQPLYFPPKTDVGLPPAQDDWQSKLHFKWDLPPIAPAATPAPTATPAPSPFASPAPAPATANPLPAAPPAG